MNSRIVYSVSIIIFLIFVCGFFITQNQTTSREKYESEILRKAMEIKPELDKVNTEIKSPDQPDMAAFQEYIITADPATGEVPTERLLESYNTTKKLQSELMLNRKTSNIMEWETSGSNMGGRTRALMYDPNDPEYKKVWAGCVTGGLWYVNDITNTNEEWTPVSDFWSNIAISCMAYDPNNTLTMYVGTGEAQTARIIYRASSGIGAGILKTVDGGQSWEIMSSTTDFDYITDIAVRDENGASVIYACVASGTYMGEDHTSHPTDGVYRSDNGGESWDQVLPLIAESSNDKPYTPADIEIASNGRIYVGTMENLDFEGGATILYSDTGLAGSWTIYSNYNDLISNTSYYNIPARTLVASSPSDPNVVYAQFAAGYTSGFVYYRGRYMAKSDDSGETWSEIPIPDSDWTTLAWHAFVLKVDPHDANIIYTGGLDLWKSTNSGANWNHISNWILMYYNGGDDYVHADQHNIQFNPGSSNSAIFGSDGGVFLTNTANHTFPVFIERNQGYNTLQFYTAAIKPVSFSQRYIGGLQDNGTLYHTGDPLDINDMIDYGDGAFCFWDENEPGIFITSVYNNSYSVWNNNNKLSGFGGNSGTFISPADYDYNENILYSNAVGSFGDNSDKILKASGIPYNVNTQLVSLGTGIDVPFSHISYSPFSPEGISTLFVGSQSGRLYKVANAQGTPETEEIGSVDFPMSNISCVAIGDTEDNLLVIFSNYGVSSIWLTMDGGESWIEKESNLPDMPIRWAIFHPENNGQVLLATEIGIWWTNTLNEETTTWYPDIDGIDNVRVDMLKLRKSDNVVLAATHGRGLFTAEYPLDIYTSIKENDVNNSFEVYPNPASDYVKIISKGVLGDDLEIKITTINGIVVYSSTIRNVHENEIKLDKLVSGTYILSLKINNELENHKLVVN